ncbi:MAG: 4-hydroxy-tetrahydrodipicolinate reductase [Bacteroidales bacterium]|nr:4-hydroxy-tetrahydrodipicolinate reductase [Bacteroidales bacterium]
MKIALIGYGQMGKEIEKTAIERGHQIVLRIDSSEDWKNHLSELKDADIAIEFSMPMCAVDNFMKCFAASIPIVTGTTGWYNDLEKVKKICLENNHSMLFASNFSIGVNILFEINQRLSVLMNKYKNYNVSIEETHHTNKIDAPSGTAITLANDIIKNNNNKNKWVNIVSDAENEIPIKSIRKENITGIHSIKYDSEIDYLEIKHSAKSRKGFALGAVIAAEWLLGKTGFYEMKDVLFK